MTKFEILESRVYRRLKFMCVEKQRCGEDVEEFLMGIWDEPHLDKETKLVANFVLGRWKLLKSLE